MRIPVAAPLALLLAGCASAVHQAPPPPAPPGAPVVRAVRVSAPPMVDGIANDPAWALAAETEVPLGDPAAGALRVKAVADLGSVFLLVQWADPTESRDVPLQAGSGPGWLWKENGVGDAVIVLLPLEGRFPEVLDGPADECTMDFWRWDAAHGDATGHAEDAVLPRSAVTTVPWTSGPTYTGLLQADAEDGKRSASDVLARGRWRDGEWTVEFARALSTGHADDRDLGGIPEIPLRLVVRERGGPADVRSTPVLRLLLPPAEPEDRQGPFPDPRGGPGGRR